MGRHWEGGALTTFYSEDSGNMLPVEGFNCLFKKDCNTQSLKNLILTCETFPGIG